MNEQRKQWDEQVKGPGKFEGESAYVPYFWEIFLDGECDAYGNTLRFEVADKDRAIFPELSDRKEVFLVETASGFVREVAGPEDYGDDDDFFADDDEAVRLSSSLSSLDDDEEVGELQPEEGDETTQTYLGFYRPWDLRE